MGPHPRDPTPLGPGPAVNLGAFRVAVVLAWLLAVDPRPAARFANFPQELLFPTGFWHGRLTRLDYPPELAWGLYGVFVPAAVAALVGWRTRWAVALMVLTGGVLLSLPQFFGKVVHYNHLVWFGALLALSPCGDALSLDARRHRRRGGPTPGWSRAYAWPLRAAVVLVALAYFFPGYWKLAAVGWEWTSAENFAAILHGKWSELDGWSTPLRIDRHPWLCRAAGVATVAFELAFLPLALWRRTRALAIVTGLLFHLGVLAVMGITIGHLAVGYAAMLPWHRWLGGGGGDGGGGRPPVRADVRRALPAACAGALLVAGNIHNGLLRREDWPLGAYPSFAVLTQSRAAVLVIRAELPGGGQVDLSERRLGRYLGASRARGLVQSILSSEEGEGREARLRALWRVWVAAEPGLARATPTAWVLVTVSTVPEDRGRVLGEEVILDRSHAAPKDGQDTGGTG